MKKYSLLLLSLLFIFTGCTNMTLFDFKPKQKQKIKITGSDTMLVLGQKIAEGYMNKTNNTIVMVTGGGSGKGIKSIINGEVEIGQLSRKITETEMKEAQIKGIKIKELKVAADGINIIVHKSNTISNLTTDELRKIFVGEITQWNEVGINLGEIEVVSREDISGTNQFLKEHILRKRNPSEYTSKAVVLSSNNAIEEEVENSKNAIGYVGMSFININIKAVGIDGIKPSYQTVKDMTYPIARELYWYYDENNEKEIVDFIKYIKSQEVKKIIADNGFVTLD